MSEDSATEPSQHGNGDIKCSDLTPKNFIVFLEVSATYQTQLTRKRDFYLDIRQWTCPKMCLFWKGSLMISLVKHGILIHFEFISHSDLSVDCSALGLKWEVKNSRFAPPCGSRLTLSCKYLLLTIVLILGLRLWQQWLIWIQIIWQLLGRIISNTNLHGCVSGGLERFINHVVSSQGYIFVSGSPKLCLECSDPMWEWSTGLWDSVSDRHWCCIAYNDLLSAVYYCTIHGA